MQFCGINIEWGLGLASFIDLIMVELCCWYIESYLVVLQSAIIFIVMILLWE